MYRVIGVSLFLPCMLHLADAYVIDAQITTFNISLVVHGTISENNFLLSVSCQLP